jgi:hypothetical protein
MTGYVEHLSVVHERGPCPCGTEHGYAYFACRCGVCGPPRAHRDTARNDCSAHHRAARDTRIRSVK